MPSSHQAQARHMAMDALGCLWLCGHCCLAGGLRSWWSPQLETKSKHLLLHGEG